ncbi:helix-turn-helix transcriptional regulator [Acrocarpospora catenulata]|uniref:helix-turn-helix transcriptional regulator n=1 Tax=Acrocarpospora catenulata TaxID=2836182 RepID=UPI001BD93731|nr:LuxR C-terminal-related transcriptional regulator [Acrocarpospora catenulata]
MWPFTGRTGELDQVRAAVQHGGGILIFGAGGSGRTRLLAEALAAFSVSGISGAHGSGARVLQVRGAGPDVPFGAFAHLLGSPECPVNPVGWAARALGPAPEVLAVDDAHLLDPRSAALVHHLVAHGGARLAATLRIGAPVPAPLLALWREGVLARQDLAPLNPRETGLLLAAALGGPVEVSTARRMHHASGGNILLLTELVPGAALTRADGQWRWSGDLTITARLRGLVEAELAELDPAETEAAALVALGEPVDLDVLLELADSGAVTRLEQRGLITVVRDSTPPRVRLANPVHARIIRERATPRGGRERLARLVPPTSPEHRADRWSAELSAREIEVARLASWNLTNREIADWLVLSPRTVANHLCRVYTKLGVHNRTDLAPLLAEPAQV